MVAGIRGEAKETWRKELFFLHGNEVGYFIKNCSSGQPSRLQFKTSNSLRRIGGTSAPRVKTALGKINFFLAPGADMFLVKFIRENFLFLTALRALA